MGNSQALEDLKLRTAAADLPLKESATNLVFGKGNPEAQVIFIGEAPGKNEDLKGVPFVGAAGKELDKQLHAIGLTIEDVYIANILKYRPPENRDPLPDEIRAHTPWLIEQIKVLRPKVICTLGNYATKFILAGCSVEGMAKVAGITSLHGKPREVTLDGITCTVVPIFHPAAILYNRSLSEAFTLDFQAVKKALGDVKAKRTLMDY